jgi:hypothetical protein
MRDFRSDTDALAALVPASEGQRQIPLGELASVKVATGPAMIRDEDGLLTYVFVDVAGRDISSYVDEASRVVRERMVPPGYAVLWSASTKRWRAYARCVSPTSSRSPCSRVPASLLQHAVIPRDGDRAAGRAVLGRQRRLVPACSATHEHRRLGRAHRCSVLTQRRASSCCCISTLRTRGVARRTPANARDLRRPSWKAPPARSVEFMTVATMFLGSPDHVGHRHRVGCVEANRRAMVGGIFTSFVELVVYPAITKSGSGTSR